MRFRIVTSLASSVLVVFTLAAAQPESASKQKKAWQWTLDERLAARHDPLLARARVEEAREHRNLSADIHVGAMKAGSAIPSGMADVILGQSHPELLLPSEIFDHIMSLGFADNSEVRAIYRDAMRPKTLALGLPVDFWERLANITRPYLNDVRTLRDIHQGIDKADPVRVDRVKKTARQLQLLECRDRAASIAAARLEFGNLFDRFLYEAAATDMFVFVQAPISASRQRKIEGGCQ